jgi:hypothetical protein
MPRGKSFSPAEKEQCRRLKAVREALLIPRTEFAFLLGSPGKRLENRELERSRWQPKDLSEAEAKIRGQLLTAAHAFEKAFGRPAFPSFAITNRIKPMKIDSLTEDQRAQLKEARKKVKSFLDALPTWEAALESRQAEESSLTDELMKLRARKSASAETAQKIATVREQLELIPPLIAEAEEGYADTLQAGSNIARSVSELLRPVLSPLFSQFNQQAGAALLPFYGKLSAPALNQILAESPAYRALQNFVGDPAARYLGTDKGSVVGVSQGLLQKLDNLLEGKDVFSWAPAIAPEQLQG